MFKKHAERAIAEIRQHLADRLGLILAKRWIAAQPDLAKKERDFAPKLHRFKAK